MGHERGSKRKGELIWLLLHEPQSPGRGGILDESVNDNQTEEIAASASSEYPRSRNAKGSSVRGSARGLGSKRS